MKKINQLKRILSKTGKMQIFTYQTGVLNLALRVGEEERAVLPRVPREMASLGSDPVSVWEASVKSSSREGILFRMKEAFWSGGAVRNWWNIL